MKISAIGSYSGIDQTTIDTLMALEKRPFGKLQEDKTIFQNRKNAWNDIRVRIQNLHEKIKELQKPELYQRKVASQGTGVMVSPGKDAAIGNYDISVQSVATKSRVIGESPTVGNKTKPLDASGRLRINEIGVVSIEMEDTLEDVVKKINEVKESTGVEAYIIDNKLILSNLKTGAKEISYQEEDTGVLQAIGLASAHKIQGNNAKITINGVSVEREDNTIKDAIKDTSITVLREGQTENIMISKDDKSMLQAASSFIEQYNSTFSFIKDAMKPGTPGQKNTRGILAGDSALARLESSLRGLLSERISGTPGAFKSLSEIGITTRDRHGDLVLNEDVFKEKLASNPNSAEEFFQRKDGIFQKMAQTISSFSDSNGVIKGKTDSFDSFIRGIDKQVEVFERRMEKKESYYISVFQKLDVALMEADVQMGWLTSQLSSMGPRK